MKSLRVIGRMSRLWRRSLIRWNVSMAKLDRPVFDRGIVSEENLNLLRSRGASYLVATPKRLFNAVQRPRWPRTSDPSGQIHPQIQVKRIERDGELYVLTRSLASEPKKNGRCAASESLKGLRARSSQAQSGSSQRTGSPAGSHLHTARTTRGTLALGVVLPQRGDPKNRH